MVGITTILLLSIYIKYNAHDQYDRVSIVQSGEISSDDLTDWGLNSIDPFFQPDSNQIVTRNLPTFGLHELRGISKYSIFHII